ncbi:DUF7146 domain-containing protein [Inhella gelatinilytica]|uniref:Toprim domain-containing protein n=1 Tax=Inhella gelatinilytica TaxID=2795030 RepID=A0A931IWD5_9BURK|nr:toprim domain-containing protein [Inhella gelatinilytica]MBH9553137.1 toprim domain-containing protein [Inhella gelatinilytica]
MANPIRTFQTAILTALDHAPAHIEPGKLHRFGTGRACWCLLFSDGRAGVFGCWRQGITETWTACDRQTLTLAERAELARQVARATAERQHQQRQQWAENRYRIVKLWGESQPLQAGDPATLYLKKRGLGGAWPLADCLRLHRGLSYWIEGRELGRYPALLAPIVAPNGQTVALHRTYLTADGRKADVPTVKKLTGAAGPLAGACIPLGKTQGGLIGISEGMETALAAWAGSGVPTVAAYCANALAGWQWPAEARRIVVFADHDRAGLNASAALRARVLKAGLRCEVHQPSEPGMDWADVWLSGQAQVIGAEVQP